MGPVWGNGSLQRFGEGSAYGSAAVALVGAAVLALRYRPAAKAADVATVKQEDLSGA
jgi:hypothetical protein